MDRWNPFIRNNVRTAQHPRAETALCRGARGPPLKVPLAGRRGTRRRRDAKEEEEENSRGKSARLAKEERK